MRVRFIPTPEGYRIEMATSDKAKGNGSNGNGDSQEWVPISGDQARAAEKTVFEAALSWKVLEIEEEETLSFFVGFSTGRNETEMMPSLSCLCMTLPGKAGRSWFP